MTYSHFDQPFVLTTDESMKAEGAVLSQGPARKDKPIAYASGTLNPELLTVVCAYELMYIVVI